MFCTQGLQQKERGRARCSKAGLALWKCIGRGMACRCILDDVAPIRLVMLQLYRWKLPNATNYAKPISGGSLWRGAECGKLVPLYHYIMISYYIMLYLLSDIRLHQLEDGQLVALVQWEHSCRPCSTCRRSRQNVHRQGAGLLAPKK